MTKVRSLDTVKLIFLPFTYWNIEYSFLCGIYIAKYLIEIINGVNRVSAMPVPGFFYPVKFTLW